MNFFRSLFELLNRPFPEEDSWAVYLWNILLISGFVAGFLYLFQPFGIHAIESHKLLICLGFGAMTFLASLLFDQLNSLIKRLRNSNRTFTFGHWIIQTIGLVFTISLANFFYARSLFGTLRWEFLPSMIYSTFAIGIFPLFFMGALALIRAERKYQHVADTINQRPPRTNSTSYSAEEQLYSIPKGQIRYVEALQNYVKIGYVSAEGDLIEQTERATLKSVLALVGKGPIVRCHRSYLVNQEAITSTAGNAQGLLLSLRDCEKKIPVSRSYVSIFKA